MHPRRDEVIDKLRQRFLSASHLGLLQPGDKLPSARDIARELHVDRRVVFAAYRMLEREGVVELRQRSSIYFAPAAAAGADNGTGDARDARQAEWVVDALLAGVMRGTPALALGDTLHRAVGTLRLRVACLECNDDQIDALCAELRADYGLDACGVEIDPLRDDTARLAGDEGAEPPAALRRADLLVTTPFHASEVKVIGERLGKPWLVAVPRADVFSELARRLADGPAYAVVADPRFAYKLGLIFRPTAGARNFRALVAERDDVGQIPAGAPVYVTRLAHERLGGAPGLGRRIPDAPVFSTASARELLAFIVRANLAAQTVRAGV
ncbi:MAG: winged helix-turn-helix domain-containing protein [Gemmatimonadaceae bacterium]